MLQTDFTSETPLFTPTQFQAWSPWTSVNHFQKKFLCSHLRWRLDWQQDL